MKIFKFNMIYILFFLFVKFDIQFDIPFLSSLYVISNKKHITRREGRERKRERERNNFEN